MIVIPLKQQCGNVQAWPSYITTGILLPITHVVWSKYVLESVANHARGMFEIRKRIKRSDRTNQSSRRISIDRSTETTLINYSIQDYSDRQPVIYWS